MTFWELRFPGSERLWQAPMLIGAGVSAGGGAYLMGSLADLPYTLATAEQDMIAPEHVQALIWKELVPELLADSVFGALVERDPERTACGCALSKVWRRAVERVGQKPAASGQGDQHSFRSHGAAETGGG